MAVNTVCQCEYPKLLIRDLKQSKKSLDSNNWMLDIVYNLNNTTAKKTLEFYTFQIQGFIEQKPCNDIMIIRDCTGKVKLTKCENALSTKKILTEGMYCGVTGVLVREKGLPEMSVVKLIYLGEDEIERNIFYEYWPTEVEDYKLFVTGIISPEFDIEKM